jgi:hypothetical protein
VGATAFVGDGVETNLTGLAYKIPTCKAVSDALAFSWISATPLVSEETVSVTRAVGNTLALTMTNAVYLTADTNTFPSSGHVYFTLDVKMSSWPLTFDTNLFSGSTALTLTSTNNYQTIIGSRPYGQTVFELR